MTTFSKPPTTIPQQIATLAARGLIIPDPARAARYLEYIGYYRLSGYFIRFQVPGTGHTFAPGSTFDAVLDLYIFDRHLRLLIMDAVERLEIALRTSIINEFCLTYGSHWYLDHNLFLPTYNHNDLVRMVEKETGFGKRQGGGMLPFEHYYKTYTNPRLPPAWMVGDALPLGAWSKMYQYFQDTQLKKVIAKKFNLSVSQLESWFHCLSYLRNLCAHHARVWDRGFTFKPTAPPRLAHLFANNTTFFAYCVMVNDLLSSITRGSHWPNRLAELLQQCPLDPEKYMGFPPGWTKDPFWRINEPPRARGTWVKAVVRRRAAKRAGH